jgi:GrpB protein
MLLGLERGTVMLSPHQEEWHQLFAEEKALILDAIGERVIAIEHVGSTAICGIMAKPVLDIMVGIPKFKNGEKCVSDLEHLGYEYKGENGVPNGTFLEKECQELIIYTWWQSTAISGNAICCSAITFYGMARPPREYNDLKLALAGRFPRTAKHTPTEKKLSWNAF